MISLDKYAFIIAGGFSSGEGELITLPAMAGRVITEHSYLPKTGESYLRKTGDCYLPITSIYLISNSTFSKVLA